MAKGDIVAPQEEIVRALYVPLWDDAAARASTQAFMQTDVSVSRTSVLPYEEIVAVFKADLSDRNHLVVATAILHVHNVTTACGQQPDEEKPPSVSVRVVEDPIADDPAGYCDNPAHSLIQGRDANNPELPRKLTRGMANRLRNACLIVPVAAG